MNREEDPKGVGYRSVEVGDNEFGGALEQQRWCTPVQQPQQQNEEVEVREGGERIRCRNS